ncbi:MAG: hypothetical protein LBK75_11265 [Oscillospiraceae bacterium]|jgi:hypothetical protein|nr:hypothetical protein [Oscillospiraceae bacterium]
MPVEYYVFPENKNYAVFAENNLSWANLDEKSEDAQIPHPGNISSVLCSVRALFEPCFGTEHVNRRALAVFPTNGDNMACARYHVIFLSARGSNWCQYAYQFAHELCHFMINADIVKPLRWFEESICELASLFFLPGITEQWEDAPPYPQWKPYAREFSAYIEEEVKPTSAVIPEGISFSEYFSRKMGHLETHEYERDINRLCAMHLLPIFEETPALWRDTLHLGKLHAGHTFLKSLQHWRELSDAKNAIEKIIALFEGRRDV